MSLKQVFACLFGLLVAVCMTTAQARTFQLGHSATESNPRQAAAEYFASQLKKLSDGKLLVKVYSNAQLGDDAQMLSQVRLGSLAFSVSSQGALATVAPQVNVIGLPFLFSDVHTAYKVLDGPIGQRLADLVKPKGVVILGYWDNGLRDITNNVRPIKTPADMKGLKIRVPPDQMAQDIISALGATPKPVAFAETYLALQQGVVDGQENPIINIYSQKFYEVQKYLSLTHHKYEFLPFVVSAATWNTFSDQEKKWVRTAADRTTAFQRKKMNTLRAKELAEIKQSGTQVISVNKAPFKKATQSVYRKWHKKYPQLVDKLERAVEKANGSN